MKPKLFCLICAACIFAGCISRSGGTTEGSAEEGTVPVQPRTISLQRAIDNPTPTGLGEIGSSITYIPLETSPRSLLRERLIINVADEMILVSDNTFRLLMFDGQGKFVRQIGSLGNGPGEHLHLFDHSLSPDGDRILFFGGDRGIFEFDTGGKYLANYPVPGGMGFPDQFLVSDDGSFIIVNGSYAVRADPSDVMAYIVGRDGTVTKSFRSSRKRQTGMFFAFSSLYLFEGDVRLNEPLSDTLYTVAREEVTPYAVFDFGAHRVAPESYLENHPDNIPGWSLRRIYESADGIFFDIMNYSSGMETRYGFFDKRSGQTRVVGTEGFTNDLDGGLPFFPNFVTADGRPGCWVQAYKLKEHVAGLDAADMTRRYGERFTRLAALAAGLADDDNPVLITIE